MQGGHEDPPASPALQHLARQPWLQLSSIGLRSLHLSHLQCVRKEGAVPESRGEDSGTRRPTWHGAGAREMRYSILTHMTLPLLLHHAATSGHRAALLNVGSIVGRFYWPGAQIYGACKASIDHLTIPLTFEYRQQLDVLSFRPTVMATAMATGTEPPAITILPQAAAHAALSHLGWLRRETNCDAATGRSKT